MGDEIGEIRADRCEVERFLAGKVRNAEAAADVQHLHRRRRRRGEPDRELYGFSLRFADRLRLQVLRSAVDVKALEGEAAAADLLEQRGHDFRVHAELLGAAAHLHARRLQLEVWIDADRDARAEAAVSRDRRARMSTSRADSTLTRMPEASAWASSLSLLAGPAKLISRGVMPASSATFKLAAGARRRSRRRCLP